MHVVRSPYARAAAAIEATPGTVEVLHAVAGTGFRPSCDRVQLISAVWDLTAPVKIYIIIIVQIHRNEHEFSCVKSLWSVGRLLTSPGCAAVLSRVVLEIRVKLHGMNRVTQF